MIDRCPYLLVDGQTRGYVVSPLADDHSKIIHLYALHFSEDDAAGKGSWLLEQVEPGGCVCWIANTVERAQRIFAALRADALDDVDCTLLHARFPLDERQQNEEAIKRRYGKPGPDRHRPIKGIVVGTQVLEQSLDLDFDLMVTDLAPVDLMLQRFGRLHRHERENRSEAHRQAVAYVNYTLDEDGQLQIGKDKFYGPWLLLRSLDAIGQRVLDPGYLDLPDDYRPLIEAVYDETEPLTDHPWRAAWDEQKAKDIKYQQEAKLLLSGSPDPARPFYLRGSGKVFLEDEDGFGWMVAQTRYQERETLTIVPIERVDETSGRTPLIGELPLNDAAGREMQLKLLQRSLRLSNPVVVSQLKASPRPALFTHSALLKRVWPLWLKTDGTAEEVPLRRIPHTRGG